MSHWQKVLQELILFPEIHGKFLNTLSLLEYIGARKIMKSQREDKITPTILAHMTEEIRHAQILKKLALRVAGQGVSSYSEASLLCGQQGRAYIQAIDQAACAQVGEDQSWTNYLLTTLVIEERAQELYPFYDELLCQLDLGGPLRGIVREEIGHLEQVQEYLQRDGKVTQQNIDAVRSIERDFYNDFFAQVEMRLNTYKAHVREPHLHLN